MEEANEEWSTSFWSELYEEASEPETLDDSCPSLTDLEAVSERYGDFVKIGTGAIKNVHQCLDHRAKRLVAYATVKEGLDPIFYELLLHEAWLTSSLQHPNIIKVYDVGVGENRLPYFTMDLKGNTTLADIQVSSSIRDLLIVFLKVCDAVAYAHKEGVVHLDLKPENIQCDRFGEVLVCDWGIGKRLQEGEWEMSGILEGSNRSDTLIGEVRGSVGYMAPEQIEGSPRKDERTDIFALGAILYFLLNGKAPFAAESIAESLQRTKDGVYDVYQGGSSVGEYIGLNAIIKRAIHVDKAQRFQQVQDVREEVERCLGGYMTKTERPSLTRKTWLFLKRHGIKASIVAVALMITSLLGVLNLNERRVKEVAQNEAYQLSHELDEMLQSQAVIDDVIVDRRSELIQRVMRRSSKVLQRQYTEPDFVEYIREQEILLKKALQLNPDLLLARYTLSHIYLIQMNVKGYHEYRVQDIQNPKRKELAEALKLFAHYSYSAESRPEISEIAALIDALDPLEYSHYDLVESMMRYDLEARTEQGDYSALMMEMLEYYNRKNGCEGVLKQGMLTIESEGGLRLRNSHENSMSILSLCELSQCSVSSTDWVNLVHFDHTHISILDLHRVKEVIAADVTVNGLEELVLSETCDAQSISSKVNSDRKYSVLLQ